MKKVLKIFLVIVIVLAIAVGSVAIWQWDNIQSIMLGLREDPEEIEKLREENLENLVQDLNNTMDVPLREMTEEEKAQIENGEATVSEIYQQMFEEKANGTENKDEKNPDTSAEENESQTQDNTSEKKPTRTKDEIISAAMSELYRIQNEFNARAEATIRQGDSYYMSIRKHPQDADARAQTIAHFTPIVRSIERECDAKVEAVIQNLERDLNNIGADTSIIGTIRATYANEKQLKLSYYSNKYLK